MFLFILVYSVVFLFAIRNFSYSKLYYIALIPVFIVTMVPSAIQYNVGTDYFSYIEIFETGKELNTYLAKGEFVFPIIVYTTKLLGASAQSVFIIVSIFNGLFFIFLLSQLKKMKFELWIYVLVFMCCTGVYHNQLNGLRQYMAVYALPLLTIFFARKQYLRSASTVMYSMFCHASSVLVFPVIYLSRILAKYNIGTVFFLIFILSAVVYGFIIPPLTVEIVAKTFPMYSKYLFEDRLQEGTLLSLLTKLYYVPIFLLFYYLCYRKAIIIRTTSEIALVGVFSLSFWLILLAYEISIFGRVSQYFSIFYSFPIYYLLNHYYKKKRFYIFIFWLVYLLIPYILKVTLLAKNEYLYQWIVNN